MNRVCPQVLAAMRVGVVVVAAAALASSPRIAVAADSALQPQASQPKRGGASAGSGATEADSSDAVATPSGTSDEDRIRARWNRSGEIFRTKGADAALTHALDTFELAKRLFGPDNGFTGQSARYVGDILTNRGNHKEAVNAYMTALVVASKIFPFTDQVFLDAADRVADAHVRARQFQDALTFYRDIIAKVRAADAKETAALGVFHRRYGVLLRRAGRFDEAEAQLRTGLAITERTTEPDDFKRVMARADLAGLLRARGKYAEAVTAYEAAIADVRRIKGPRDVNTGIMLDNLGYALIELGRMADAERVQRAAVDIFETALGPGHLTTAVGYANIALLLAKQGRVSEAETLFERALTTYRAKLPGSDARIGVLLDNYAGLARQSGDRKKARDLYEQALASLTKAHPETHPEVAKVLNNLALEEAAQGNPERAETLLTRAVAINEAVFGARHHMLGVVLGNLADVQMDLNKAQASYETMQRAVAILESTVGTDHPQMIKPLRLLSAMFVGAKRYDAALVRMRQAVHAETLRLERLRIDPEGGARAVDGDNAYTTGLHVLWRLRGARPDQADTYTREAFELAQRASATDAARSVAQIGARFAAGDAQLAVLVRRRQDLAKAWKTTNAQLLSAITQQGSTPADPKRKRLDAERTRLADALAKADAKLAAAFPQFSAISNPQPLSVDAVQTVLGDDEAFVQFARQVNHYHVWVVTKAGVVWRQLDTRAPDIIEHVKALRCGLDPSEWVGSVKPLACLDRVGATPDAAGRLPFATDRAHALYEALIAPVADAIGDRHMIVVPETHLARLPFHVLVKRKPAAGATFAELDWLMMDNAISVVPSAASLKVLRSVNAKPRGTDADYLAVANPLLTGPSGLDRSAFERGGCRAPADVAGTRIAARSGTGAPLARGGDVAAESVVGLTPLADTVDEVCQVARDLERRARPTSLLLGATATETVIAEANANGTLKRAGILHFATHGLVAGEIAGLAEPALVLTPPDAPKADDDGLLTASEVARLDLDADWVILSACNTAAGATPGAEALSGLARAFIYAGARALLVSHWPVQSAAAVRLTTGAIARMAGDPALGRAEALRLAMRDLVADPSDAAWAHPQVWAPFVVVGEAGGTAAEAAVTKARVGPDGEADGTRVPAERTAAPARSSRPITTRNAPQSRAEPAAATPSEDDDWRRRVFDQD